jgi:hypothetical protein
VCHQRPTRYPASYKHLLEKDNAMRLVFITNDKYVQRAQLHADYRIENNKKVSNTSNINRPRIFFVEDDKGDFVKCFSLTSKKSHSMFCRFGDKVSKLPKPCLFSLERDGCIILSNPFFVPKLYIQEIDTSYRSGYVEIDRNFDRFENIKNFIVKHKQEIKDAIEILWNNNTHDYEVLRAQEKCVDLIKCFNYCANELKFIKNSEQLSNLQKLQTELETSKISTIENITDIYSILKQDTIDLAKQCNVKVGEDDIIEAVGYHIESHQKENQILKHKQGIK